MSILTLTEWIRNAAVSLGSIPVIALPQPADAPVPHPRRDDADADDADNARHDHPRSSIASAWMLLIKPTITRLFRSREANIMATSLPDAQELSDDVLEALRLRAVRGCQLGFTEAELADILGVRRETVCHWWSAYADGGLEALPHDRIGRPVGSRRVLSDDQAARIQQLLRTHQPEELGIPAALWTRRAVGELIRQEFAIVVAVSTVGLYLKRWGFTAKRPRRHARDRDPEEVRQWLEETYPAIEKRAKQEEAEIYWDDEVGVAADQQPATVWNCFICPVTRRS